MQHASSDEILKFWFEEIEHSSWFKKDPAFDQALETRFGDTLAMAQKGQLDQWCDEPNGRLALIIVLDQFSRNIHRDSGEAFSADAKALGLTVDGIEAGADKAFPPEQRAFYYLPLRHAEDLAMQELGLLKTRELNAEGYGSDKYAVDHLEIIQRFGRFPHRNKVLGRPNTEEEEAYLSDGKAGF